MIVIFLVFFWTPNAVCGIIDVIVHHQSFLSIIDIFIMCTFILLTTLHDGKMMDEFYYVVSSTVDLKNFKHS